MSLHKNTKDKSAERVENMAAADRVYGRQQQIAEQAMVGFFWRETSLFVFIYSVSVTSATADET